MLLLLTLFSAHTHPAPLSQPLVLTHLNVIDVTDGSSQSNMTVIIQGNHIAAVGKTGEVSVPQSAQTIEAGGKYLIPGLWDMHAHTLTNDRYEYSFPLLLANGITGVREMGNNLPPEKINELRQEILEGRRLGPRFGALTYSLVDGPGTQFDIAVEVSTPNQGRQLVKTYKEQGADFIKPYNLLAREVYLAIADEAQRLDIPLEGHVPFSMTVAEVAELGQISIEHNFDVLVSCSRNESELREEIRGKPKLWGQAEAKAAATYNEPKAEMLFAHLVRHGTWSCPTIDFYRLPFLIGDDSEIMKDSRMKYLPQSLRDRWHETFLRLSRNTIPEYRKIHYEMRTRIVGEMHRAGVRILAGTDTGATYAFPGFSLHDELEALVGAGLSPLEALQTATLNPAKFLGQEKQLGTIEKGKTADLVLLEVDPLENISNTHRIAAVIANGRYFPKESLRRMLDDAEAIANKQ